MEVVSFYAMAKERQQIWKGQLGSNKHRTASMMAGSAHNADEGEDTTRVTYLGKAGAPHQQEW